MMVTSDLVLGNWGLNTKLKASSTKPITMYVNDFDNNGKSEFILNWYPPLEVQAYPFATKQEITVQLPGLRKEILKYADYAPKTYESLFPPEVKARSIPYEVNYTQSAILWNNGNNQFELSALPLEAQLSPVFGIVAEDMNDDGFVDIWMGGNFYAMKPQVGRHDASRGVLLLGSADGNFTYIAPKHSGLYVKGEVRDSRLLKTAGGFKLLIARNNDTVVQFEKLKE